MESFLGRVQDAGSVRVPCWWGACCFLSGSQPGRSSCVRGLAMKRWDIFIIPSGFIARITQSKSYCKNKNVVRSRLGTGEHEWRFLLLQRGSAYKKYLFKKLCAQSRLVVARLMNTGLGQQQIELLHAPGLNYNIWLRALRPKGCCDLFAWFWLRCSPLRSSVRSRRSCSQSEKCLSRSGLKGVCENWSNRLSDTLGRRHGIVTRREKERCTETVCNGDLERVWSRWIIRKP